MKPFKTCYILTYALVLSPFFTQLGHLSCEKKWSFIPENMKNLIKGATMMNVCLVYIE